MRWKFWKKKEPLPQGICLETSNGDRCYCPICPIGIGHEEPLIAGGVELYTEKCEVCGTTYQGLRICSIPSSRGW